MSPVPTDSPSHSGPSVVDWGIATSVARRVAGRDPFSESYLASSLTTDFASVTEQAAALVGEHTRLEVSASAAGIVLSRHEWVDANVRSMRRLFAPLSERFAHRMGPFRVVTQGIAGTESGILLGIMAQRVLGQYDLFFSDASGEDAVFYVGGNVLEIEKRFAFRPRDFRLWIALHEVTHRAQFAGIPWLREYFLGLVDEMFAIADPDPRALIRAARSAIDRVRNGAEVMADGGLLTAFIPEHQRVVFEKIQALMSLLEGHGNAVMNALGRTHVDGQERMAAALSTRRRTRGISGLVMKLIGLDAKMRQYEVGEQFIAVVEAEAGPRAIDAAWRGPAFLPTLAELDAPLAWLARVEASEPASDGR